MLMISIYNPGPHDIQDYMFAPEAGHQAFYSVQEGARIDVPAPAARRMLADHEWLVMEDSFDPEHPEPEVVEEVKVEPSEEQKEEVKEEIKAEGFVPVEEKPKKKPRGKELPLTEAVAEPEPEVVQEEVKLEAKSEHLCLVCGFEAKSAFGLRAHGKKHK